MPANLRPTLNTPSHATTSVPAALGASVVVPYPESGRPALLPWVAAQLDDARTAGYSYSYAVVLVAINDLLAHSLPATAVFPALQDVYSAILGAGTSVLAIPPFPSTLVDKDDPKELQRQQLRLMILVGGGRPYTHLSAAEWCVFSCHDSLPHACLLHLITQPR